MLMQIMWKIEKVAEKLEFMANDAKNFVTREITKRPNKKIKDSVARFFEFFVIEPVSLDPYGIIKKLEHIIQNQKDRFSYFIDQIAPDMDKEKKENIKMGIAGGIELYMLAKIVRHYVEIIKQTNSYQIALLLQMQIPLIEKTANSLLKGTKSLAKGEPVGDGIGPLVAAELIGNARVKEIEEDTIMAKIKINGRNAFVVKARGPGGRLGRPGKAVEKLVKKYKIARIITIDAAGKLEGEKTGSVAEGVGVAMGGPGVEKSYIESVAVQKNIPLDSIVVKMKPEEAIMPMPKAVADAVPKAIEYVMDAIRRTKKGDSIIIVGVGNTSGIGNNKKDVENVYKWVKRRCKQKERTT